MSYAGTFGAGEECRHHNYWRNCTKCVIERQEANGKRDEQGVLHSDNGAGWCVGHIEKDLNGNDLCTLLVRHCPVLNTSEQLKQNLIEDLDSEVQMRESVVRSAAIELNRLKQELAKAINKRAAIEGG